MAALHYKYLKCFATANFDSRNVKKTTKNPKWIRDDEGYMRGWCIFRGKKGVL